MRESNSLYCSPVASFYCIRVREHKICQRITLYNPGFTGFLLKEDEAKTKCKTLNNKPLIQHFRQ